MPPVGFELTISAGELPKTYTLERAATGTGFYLVYSFKIQNTDHQMPKITKAMQQSLSKEANSGSSCKHFVVSFKI